MTPDQILQVLMNDELPQCDTDWAELTGRFAHHLSTVSDRLSQEELVQFLTIGVAIYRRGMMEHAAGIDTRELLKKLDEFKKHGDSE